MFVIVNGQTFPLAEIPTLVALFSRAGHVGLLAGPTIMRDTAVRSTPEIGRPFTFKQSQPPSRQSETNTMSGG